MRSITESCLIMLGCTGMVVALSACSGEGAPQQSVQNHVENSPVPVEEARPVRTAAATAEPVTDALHFDLECDVHGRMISDSHPEIFRGTDPANVRAWHESFREIVDLQAMRICDSSVCKEHGTSPIVSATPDRITLYDRPGFTMFIRRRGWQYERRDESLGQVSVTTGRCVKREFSGFPVATRPASSGNN